MQQTTTIEIDEHSDSNGPGSYIIYGPTDSAIDAVTVNAVKIDRLGPAEILFEAGTTSIDFSQKTEYSIMLTTTDGIVDNEHTTATITVGEA